MKITVSEKNYDIVELYHEVAKQLGYNANECEYDCRRINVAANIQDGFFEYYKELGKGRVPENDIKTQTAMLLACYGPKVDKDLHDNEVEVFDGFIANQN